MKKKKDAEGIQGKDASGRSEAELRYAAVFEQSPDGLLIIDAEGKIIDFNRAAHTDLGYSRKEFSKLSISDIDPLESPEEIRASIQRAISEKKAEFEVTHRTKSGQLRNVLVITQAIVLSGRTVLHTIWRDITDRKAAEKALLESEAKYRDLFENAGDAVFVLDAGLRYVDVNRRGLDLLGYTKEELLGRQPFDFIPEEQRPRSAAEFAKLRRKGSYETFEGRVLRKGGRWIDIEVNSTAIFRDSVFTGSRDIVRDITDRKQADAALREHEKRLAESQRIARIGSWEHNLGTGQVFWSDELFRLLGLDPKTDPADFKMFFDMVHPDDRPALKTAIDETLRLRKPFSIDYRFLLRDGTTRVLHAQAELLPDASGNMVVLSGTGQDITERKNMEKALKESEQNLRLLFDSSTDGIFILDMQGNFVDVNRTAHERLGYARDEMLSMKINELDPPEFASRVPERLAQIREQGQAVFESAHIKKDGSRMPVEINSRILDYKGMKVYFSLIRDITERKKAEEAKDRLLNAISASTQGIAITDEKDRFVYVNDAHARIFGYIQNELIGKTWRVTVPPEFEALIEGVLPKTLHNRAVGIWSGECPAIRKDGTILPTEITATARWDEAGSYLGHICIVRDISERKQAEKALKESEERFKSLFDSAPDAIFVADMESGVIVDANPVASRMLRLPHDKIIGLHQSRLHPPSAHENSKEAFAEHVKEASEGVPTHPIEIAVLCSSGDEIPVESMAKMVTIQGKHFLMGIFRDISERKKAEEKMKSALSEKETLLRELYHRTKNNMQVITSLLNLQSHAIDDKKTLQIIEDTKNRIHSMALVHEKLYKAKDLSRVNLRDYIADLAASLMDSHQIIKGKISLLLDIDNIPVSIDTITPCGLVINELMTNTLKYAFPDNRAGKIKISAHLNAEGIIELRFSDDGIGFREGIDLQKTKSLGLKIVNILVETQLKGKMVIESAPQGTGFVISFREMDKRERI